MRKYKKKKHSETPFLKAYVPGWLPSVKLLTEPAGLSEQRMLVLLHQFYLCWFRGMKNKKLRTEDNFFPVHHSVLSQVCTSKYARYVKVLINAGIIEMKVNALGRSTYLAGVYSKLYRFVLPPGHLTPKFKIKKVTDFYSISAVLRTRDKYALGEYNDSNNHPLTDIHKQLRSFVLQAKIDIKIVTAIMKVSGHDPARDDYAAIDLDYFRILNDREIFWFKVDDFGRRCHTPFTSLESKYRSAIRFDGHANKPLVHIDIANSQPYFSSILGRDNVMDDLLPEFNAMATKLREYDSRQDFKLYKKLCATGEIYQYMANELGNERHIVKQQFFRAVLFAKRNVYGEDKKMKEVFNGSFPSVSRFFASVKRMNEIDFPELADIIQERRRRFQASNNSHKILPCAMQRLESEFITKIIARMLIVKNLVPFLTIHDSYLVLPEHESETKETIREAFRAYGIEPPSLKTEVLSHNSVN